MSYQRFGDDSDVYVYMSVCGFFSCCMCRLQPENSWGGHQDKNLKTIKGMINHMKIHAGKGHEGTEHAIECLTEDLKKYGNHWGDIDKAMDKEDE